VQQETIGRKNSWKDSATTIFGERGCNGIKKKRELLGSQPASLDLIIYIGDKYDCKRVVVRAIIVTVIVCIS
jgi:hypothetical protein